MLYIGGDFDYVGPVTGSAVKLDGLGQVDTNLPRVNGSVYAVVADDGGGWFIGGEFDAVGGVARNNLAHINAAGILDAAWYADANAAVRALALSGSTLYVGGDFNSAADTVASIGGQMRDYLAALSAVDGSVDVDWDPDADGSVHSLLLSGASTLYVGGDFTAINGGVSRNHLAELSTMGVGSVTGWDPDANGVVRALALSGSTLYVGGDFTLIGDISRNRIAAVSTSGGSLPAWNPSAGGPVYDVAEQGGDILVGGAFASVGGKTRRNLAALDLVSGQASDWNPATDGEGFSLVLGDPQSEPATWDSKTAWRPSSAPDGSPGLVNPAPPQEDKK